MISPSVSPSGTRRDGLFAVLAVIVLTPLVMAWLTVGVLLPRHLGLAGPSAGAWLAAFGCGVLLMVTLWAVASRLARRWRAPSDEAVGELSMRLDLTERESNEWAAALSAAMGQFSRALSNTHDADGLLTAVAEAARFGVTSGNGTAVIYLGDAERLTERVTLVPDGPPDPHLSRQLDQLASLASRAAVRAQPCRGDLAPVGGRAMAVPIMHSERMLGVLAVASARPSAAAHVPPGERVGQRAEQAGQAPGTAIQTFTALRPDAPTADWQPMTQVALRELATATAVALTNVQEHMNTRRLSITDPLTGVGNLRHLVTTLGREVGRAQRFGRSLSVLMLDLDNFKDVNDTGGHAFGDTVLQEFAARLRSCVREVDVVARRGGEEFALVLPETGSAGAEAVMRRVLERMRNEPFTDGYQRRMVTVSIGVASFPEHGRRADDLLAAADAALYAAKRAGRDRGCVAPSPAPSPVVGLPASGGERHTSNGVTEMSAI